MKRLTIALIGALALVAGCSDDGPEDDLDASASAGSGGGSGIEQSGEPAPGTVDYFNAVVGDRVFFATDRHDLSSEAQRTLAGQAEWLAANPGTTAVIEGHADERGTREYNLALGARRANSAHDFLVSQGIDADRLRTVSYGKERPVELCSEERCWSENRRAVTVVSGAPTS